jgi:hypothetical protein
MPDGLLNQQEKFNQNKENINYNFKNEKFKKPYNSLKVNNYFEKPKQSFCSSGMDIEIKHKFRSQPNRMPLQ